MMRGWRTRLSSSRGAQEPAIVMYSMSPSVAAPPVPVTPGPQEDKAHGSDLR